MTKAYPFSEGPLSNNPVGKERSEPTPRGGFEFVPGPNSQSLRIVYYGFWDDSVLQRYGDVLRARAVASGGASPIRRVLLDLRDCTVQSRSIIEGQSANLEAYAGQISSYGMLLPSSSLPRVQMKRLTEKFPITLFETERDALNWLAQGTS